MKKIHIIGGGNLGLAIAKGLLNYTTDYKVVLTRRNIDKIKTFNHSNLIISNDNLFEIEQADVIMLCIKPFQVLQVIQEIKPFLKNQIVCSAVSGFDLNQFVEATEQTQKVFRIMPNIAAEFAESATCISFKDANETDQKIIQDLFNALGTCVAIDEKLMDAATVLGACGTAYALRYIRASMQAGIEIGFDANTALQIAAQTVKGAAKMALDENIHPEQLIDRVTTPQGCTIVGLNEMEHQGFSSALIKGIKTSLNKITTN